jgi:hypothetical protein
MRVFPRSSCANGLRESTMTAWRRNTSPLARWAPGSWLFSPQPSAESPMTSCELLGDFPTRMEGTSLLLSGKGVFHSVSALRLVAAQNADRDCLPFSMQSAYLGCSPKATCGGVSSSSDNSTGFCGLAFTLPPSRGIPSPSQLWESSAERGHPTKAGVQYWRAT